MTHRYGFWYWDMIYIYDIKAINILGLINQKEGKP